MGPELAFPASTVPEGVVSSLFLEPSSLSLSACLLLLHGFTLLPLNQHPYPLHLRSTAMENFQVYMA